MIAAFIVLLVVALAGGGYIAYDIAREKKLAAKPIKLAHELASSVQYNKKFAAVEIDPIEIETVATEEAPTEKATEEPSETGPAPSETEPAPSETGPAPTKEEEPTEEKPVVEKSATATDEKKCKNVAKSKQGIINIDTLSHYFEDGEVVSAEEIKKRVNGFDKNVTYLKVLSDGTLDKKLTVEANAFSAQAVKAITKVGGKIVRL